MTDSEFDEFYEPGEDTRLFATGNEPIIPRSGDTGFDRALARTLARISQVLDVAPGFAYYDDFDGHNAFAAKRVRLNGADGTVLFGTGLLNKLLQARESPDAGVAAICAHEFGHILQYKRGLDTAIMVGQRTVKRVELQADFFAGYFAGRRKIERPSFPAAVFAVTQYNAGDNINHPNHHGTHAERAAAIVRGFEVAYNERKDLGDAIASSMSYVSTL